MTEESPAPQFPGIHDQTGWQYVEFLGPGTQGNPAKATPGAPAGTSNPGGIQAALTWLDQSALPGAGAVFGMIDSGGTVRLYWYGTTLVF
jgi:hypothetical protein